NTEKIVFPVLSTSPSYVIDTSNFQFTGGGNGPYYSIVSKSEYSIYYLAGLLSHPVLEAMVKSRASEFRGAYYSHGKQFIENLPIKTIDFNNPLEKRAYNQICSVVKSIIETKNRLDNIKIYAKRSVMDRKLNRLYNYLYVRIDLLYGFSNEDIDSIKEKNL